MGGNDIACLPKNSISPPNNNQIITAIKNIALEVFHNNIIPIVIPILPRDDTKEEITGTTIEKYNRRRGYINWRLEKELTEEIGYNPIPFHPGKERKLIADKIHLSENEYKNITESIIERVKEITQKMSIRTNKERNIRPREEHNEARRQRHKKDTTEEVTQKLQNKAIKWRLDEEQQQQQHSKDEIHHIEELRERRKETGAIPKDKTEKVLELAATMKNILAPSMKDESTQTPSIIEILPQLLEELNIKITQRMKETSQ